MILGRPVYQPPARSGILKWVGGFGLVAIILGGVIGHYSQSLKKPTEAQHGFGALLKALAGSG